MARNENIRMQNIREEERLDITQDEVNLDQTSSRPLESARTRACVLLGSAILQLPIWGMKHDKPSWSIVDPHLPIQVSPWAMASSKSTTPTTGLCKAVAAWPVSLERPRTVSCTCPCHSSSHSSPDDGPASVVPLPSVAWSWHARVSCSPPSAPTSGTS